MEASEGVRDSRDTNVGVVGAGQTHVTRESQAKGEDSVLKMLEGVKKKDAETEQSTGRLSPR